MYFFHILFKKNYFKVKFKVMGRKKLIVRGHMSYVFFVFLFVALITGNFLRGDEFGK